MKNQYVNVNGEMVLYFEKELFCIDNKFRKWIDNYGYIWFTDKNNNFVAESELELSGEK
jgi:hypothetical protein